MVRMIEVVFKITAIAKSQIYKKAFSPYSRLSLGFLLGEDEDFSSPKVFFSLFSNSIQKVICLESIKDAFAILENQLPLVGKICEFSETKVVGIYATMNRDETVREFMNEAIGFLIDQSQRLEIPYFFLIPTDGGEAIWGIGIYSSYQFPHKGLAYKTLHAKSCAPNKNYKRINRLWNSLRKGTSTSDNS